jgi:hypothetical protein
VDLFNGGEMRTAPGKKKKSIVEKCMFPDD